MKKISQARTRTAVIRLVKVLDRDLQLEARKKGYKPDDIVVIVGTVVGNSIKYSIKEKIEGSIVEWQRKRGLIIDE
jgi:ribosomal protein L18E